MRWILVVAERLSRCQLFSGAASFFLACPWDGLTPSEAEGITAIFTLIAARLNAFPPRFHFPSSTCQHSQISWLKCDKDIGGSFLPGGFQGQNPSVITLIDCNKTNMAFFNYIFCDQSLLKKKKKPVTTMSVIWVWQGLLNLQNMWNSCPC